MIKDFFNKSFVLCIRTSKSKSPKPIEGNLYVVHKRVQTSWGDKIILSNEKGEEIWGDPSYLKPLSLNEISEHKKEFLLRGYELFLDKIYTPTICTIINKNGAGFEVIFSSGQRTFLTSKLIRNFESLKNKKINETIAIEIPVWFAKKQNIIKESGENQ